MKYNVNSSGFTLIEILVVVVIASILSVLGIQMIASGSVERNLQQHGRILQSSLEYSCDQATLQNQPYGIKIHKNGYVFTQFVNQQWLDVELNESLYSKDIADGSIFSLRVEDEPIILSEDVGDLPQIYCDSTGQISVFELTVSDVTQKHHYVLKTMDFWNIEGHWIDDKEF